jgi:hypothetical protein
MLQWILDGKTLKIAENVLTFLPDPTYTLKEVQERKKTKERKKCQSKMTKTAENI